ncbi:MAG: isochorismatase family protein [Hyphomicrobiaceae bacterium]
MHTVSIRQEIVDRVLARRGRLHLFDHFAAAETAMVIIDMQPTFVAPGSPAEVPAARGIVQNVSETAAVLRHKGVLIVWVTHANSSVGAGSDWDGFFDVFVADEVRQRTIASLAQDSPDTRVWHEFDIAKGDVHIFKNRYSALIQGSSPLERILRSRRIRNLLIAGTKTNICCEATARDAMMLDFNVVMLSDCTAALSDDEHRATLETFIQQFGDVLTGREALALVGS